MTQRYAKLRDEALKRAADLAGDIIDDAMQGAEESEETQGKKLVG
jgi:hypothetical protein